MDHTLTEADVPKVEAGKILIFREKRFQSTKTLRGDQIQILGETFTVQQNGYCKNRSNGGAISFMDGVYYIVVDHMQTLQKLQKLAIAEGQIQRMSVRMPMKMYLESILPERRQKRSRAAETWRIIPLGKKYGVVWRRVRGRAVNRKELLALYGGFFFLGIFLGTVFLAVTVMIIVYKQVSEGYEDKERYRIMEQVGMSNVEVKSAIETRIRMVFFLPIMVAVLHVVAAFPLIRRVLSLLIMDSGQLFVWCLVTTVLSCICGYLLCGISDHFKNLLPHCWQSGALNYLWKVTGSITENTFFVPLPFYGDFAGMVRDNRVRNGQTESKNDRYPRVLRLRGKTFKQAVTDFFRNWIAGIFHG